MSAEYIFPGGEIRRCHKTERLPSDLLLYLIRDEPGGCGGGEGDDAGHGEKIFFADLDHRSAKDAADLGDGWKGVVELDGCIRLMGEGEMSDLCLGIGDERFCNFRIVSRASISGFFQPSK